jgi:GTP-binding protein EngB required for normal cell division
MNIVIEPKPQPLEDTPMVVDGSLSDKLDKYEVLAYLNTHSTNFIGRPKSGKSSLLQSMFKSKHALKGL